MRGKKGIEIYKFKAERKQQSSMEEEIEPPMQELPTRKKKQKPKTEAMAESKKKPYVA